MTEDESMNERVIIFLTQRFAAVVNEGLEHPDMIPVNEVLERHGVGLCHAEGEDDSCFALRGRDGRPVAYEGAMDIVAEIRAAGPGVYAGAFAGRNL